MLYSESASSTILIMQWNEADREHALILGKNLADIMNGMGIN